MDEFSDLWIDQAHFMDLLIEKRGFPQYPLDMSKKDDQRFIKNILHDLSDEVCEVRQELTNSKRHRATEIQGFDRDHYIEELVDTMKFLLEVLILSGISRDEFVQAYFKKSEINVDGINKGY